MAFLPSKFWTKTSSTKNSFVSLMKITSLLALLLTGTSFAADYLAPNSLGLHKDQIVIANNEAQTLSLFQPQSGKILKNIKLPAKPNGFLIEGDTAYVSVGGALGKVVIVDLASKKVTKEIAVGHTPLAPVKHGNTLYVPNRFNNSIAAIDLKSGKTLNIIQAKREVSALAISPDGKTLWATNLLPAGRADGEFTAADLTRYQDGKSKHFPLSNGTQGVRGMSMSPDGKYLAISHILSRYQVPTTQLDRGWINTNAVTIINTENPEVHDAILLDDVDFGAANPWAVTFTPDGKKLLVTHAGIHEVSVIDFPALIEKMKTSKEQNKNVNQLSFLDGIRTRIKLPLNGPRSLVTDGKTVYSAGYYSDNLVSFPLTEHPQIQNWKLGDDKEQPVQWRGERYFNDATLCFQAWESCASCHPDSRVDALDWDLLNDGLGNPKNTRSMFLSHRASPVMTLGIRANAEVAVKAGFHHIQFVEPEKEHTDCVDEYLKNMPTVPSPILNYKKLAKPIEKETCWQCHGAKTERGSLTEAGKRGKALFKKQGCTECHPHPYFTNKQLYDVGTLIGVDEGKKLIVPTLVEIWRTGPYMHDGRATTIKEVITTHNKDDKRGKTSTLTPQEIDDLVEYLKSL